MKLGKLNLKDLSNIISTYKGVKKRETLLGSSIGEDSCVIDMKLFEDDLMVISSDPITFTSKDIGKLSITINTNDIYASGGDGYGVILTILIPEHKGLDDFKCLMEDIHKECLYHNLEILGGHTEVTGVVNDIVVSVTILGTLKRKNLRKSSTANKGDLIFLTKTLGIEGTILLFEEFKDRINVDYSNEIAEFRDKLSIKNECMILRGFDITSMHDITEGGMIGALFEMCSSSSHGFRIFRDRVSIHPITKNICSKLNKDVMRLISSGSLIFTSHKNNEEDILREFSKHNIECNVVGEIIDDGVYFMNENGKDSIISFDISDSYFL